MADALDRMASTQSQGDALDRMASKVAGVGKTGVRLKGETQAKPFGDSFVGTLASDFGAVPEVAYTAVRHPFQAASGVIQGVRELPADLWDDIKNGKFGKIGARALELIIPGMGSSKARELAMAADAAAARTAARIAASKLPEAIGTEVKNSLTPGIVRRIRERLNPAPSNTPAVATVDAPAGFDIAPPASTGSGMSPSARPSSGVIPPVAGSLPSRPLTAPGVASMGDAQKLAAWMKSGSLSQPEAALMDAGDWKLAAQGAGVAEPSAATIKAAMDQLPSAKSATQIKVRRSK